MQRIERRFMPAIQNRRSWKLPTRIVAVFHRVRVTRAAAKKARDNLWMRRAA